MLPTNLLDMVRDPYSEDRQLAAPKEIVNLVERFESLILNFMNPRSTSVLSGFLFCYCCYGPMLHRLKVSNHLVKLQGSDLDE